MRILKTFSIVGLTTLGLGLSACQKPDAETAQAPSTQKSADVKTVSIGFQKSALNLLVARDQKLFEQQFPHAKIEWKEFPAGPQMLEALAVGAVDYGYVGNTPPIFAQAANKDLNYLGYEVVPADSLAVVLPANSSIKTIQELRGKRVAVQKGSSAHELLAKTLQKAGLTWTDIQPIWLPPADARAAFDKKSIDAWVIWDPFLSAAQIDGHAKVLIESGDFPKSYSFYIANPKVIQTYPDAGEKFLSAVNAADQWIVGHQPEAEKIYQQSTGLAPTIAAQAFGRRLKPSPVLPLTPEVVQAQQQIADLFKHVQLIPNTIQVQQQVWTPSSH
ncbi:sulfonate ABC transporter substrate-binding protein [Acinetobacter sp. ANC 5054]|uniref:aliphatic sulfonate ABC transporter substrate-binding protein n=1 Tax=Acinetobacter sp. ANC 5054 TaxID=1977877 RepID=UPI000A34F7A0|nr:aliphatic sulfonate ABC transporter substrate-binding protein [Acinetobacter sp. ANC 5054]OTG84603.1 sulfonate ABC transporter substrate-binding protein [Acinetobacter sp. ANC 5054]